MKKILLAATLAFSCVSLNAQENYTVKMSYKIEGLPEEYAGMAENDIVTYLKGEKSKIEVTSMMGGQIISNDGETTTVLAESMGNKTGWIMTKADMEAEEKENAAKKTTKPTIEYTTEKKMIAGYECTKAIVTSINGKEKKELKTTVWYTDKIKQPSAPKSKGKKGMMGGPDLGDLKGFPMQTEMTMNQQGMEMKVISTVTEVITTPIDDSVFKVSTEGYKMQSYKEMKEQQKKEMEAAGEK
jgi:hypothetical protein